MVYFSDPNLRIDEQCSSSYVMVLQQFVKKTFFYEYSCSLEPSVRDLYNKAVVVWVTTF